MRDRESFGFKPHQDLKCRYENQYCSISKGILGTSSQIERTATLVVDNVSQLPMIEIGDSEGFRDFLPVHVIKNKR